MSKSKIQWTEATWNPVTGCSKISEGCRNCYAEVMTRRLQGMGQSKYRNGFRVTLHPESLDEPQEVKKPTMFFVCSMADLFHAQVPCSFIEYVIMEIEKCDWHTFQLLTKRTELMYNYFHDWWGFESMPKNCWLGTTVENEEAKPRIEWLKRIENAPVRFLSCEPLLSDLGKLDLNGIDWVIVGGESGPNARPMKKEWVLNIKRQCEEQGVPFFFKQWGTWGQDGVKRNKKDNGNFINGKQYMEYPTSYTISKKQ